MSFLKYDRKTNWGKGGRFYAYEYGNPIYERTLIDSRGRKILIFSDELQEMFNEIFEYAKWKAEQKFNDPSRYTTPDDMKKIWIKHTPVSYQAYTKKSTRYRLRYWVLLCFWKYDFYLNYHKIVTKSNFRPLKMAYLLIFSKGHIK